MAKNAFVTLATSDEYAIGALVLAQSIRTVGTEADIVILVSNGVSSALSDSLTSTFTKVIKINELTSGNTEILNLIQRPELGVTISKIHAWKLTEYEKCVFLDADCLVIKPVDELFQKEELSAVCDLGWPDCFNSGVFVFKPSQDTFDGLLDLVRKEGSFDGGDQGLLNVYFSDWLDSDISKRLSFIYNMHSTASYTYLPAFRKFGERVKIVHFLGAIKPWHYSYDKVSGEITSSFLAQHNMGHVTLWWQTFVSVKDKLPNDLGGIAGQLANLEMKKMEEDYNRKKRWESGLIDYLGDDSFENIQKKLTESLGNQ